MDTMTLCNTCKRMIERGRTGGLAKKIVPHCRKEIILDEELLLKGLMLIYRKNK